MPRDRERKTIHSFNEISAIISFCTWVCLNVRMCGYDYYRPEKYVSNVFSKLWQHSSPVFGGKIVESRIISSVASIQMCSFYLASLFIWPFPLSVWPTFSFRMSLKMWKVPETEIHGIFPWAIDVWIIILIIIIIQVQTKTRETKASHNNNNSNNLNNTRIIETKEQYQTE